MLLRENVYLCTCEKEYTTIAMISQFSPRVSEILAFSREEAARLANGTVGPEHLLLGILKSKDSPVLDVLRRSGLDVNSVRGALEAQVRPQRAEPQRPISDMVLNERANSILKLAVLEARIQRTNKVDESHLLLAILHDSADNGAKRVLEHSNLNYGDALSLLANPSLTKTPTSRLDLPDTAEEDSAPGQRPTTAATGRREQAQSKTPVLDNYGTDLTREATEGKLDPVVGREGETRRVVEILCRRKKNNPVLIGEPGVGKSAIVEGLAQMIAQRRVSPLLYGRRLISIDMTAIVAGTKYRGQFEERLRGLIKEIEQNPDIIVFIDEIHTMVGAGSAPGTMDAANILKPALARGTIQCIGATTLDEYRESIEKDGALERRFQKIIVEPTNAEETLAILRNIRPRYEYHHHVRYSDEALEACVALTGRYITDRQFPDKAIDAMDEAGARIHLSCDTMPPELDSKEKELEQVAGRKNEAVRSQNFELAASYRDREANLQAEVKALRESWLKGEAGEPATVSADDVADVVSVMSGVPVQRVHEDENERLRTMGDRLREKVVAQDAAIEKMVRAIQRNRVGLHDSNRPIGAFMFLGPTGVGKTYLAKRLAERMFGSGDAMIRIDMSEYSESFNVSRLIGAPPGYVGYDQGGQLTEKVRRRPYSIVLLDEIEKAHANVFNMLLQVLDEGRLTDGNGRKIDFRNTVVIMTSNAGTRRLKEFAHGVGFGAASFGTAMSDKDKEYARSIVQKSLSKQFSPEFLNRLDDIITFDQLDREAIRRIADIELQPLVETCAQKGYTVSVDDSARDFLAEKGYDVQFGARPIKRAIQEYVEDELCARILDGTLRPGGTAELSHKDGEEKLTLTVN